MKILTIFNGWFLLALVSVSLHLYTMEQDKVNWRYSNNIGGELEEFDFQVDEKKLGLNFLVPDDVNYPTRWVEDPENETEKPYDLPKIFTKVFNIRKKWTYEPPKVKSDQLITWLVIHGTFGQDTKGYFDDEDKKEQNFRHIKRAASAYATDKAKNLELLSFKWASKLHSKFYGGLSDTDRVKGAHILHKFLQYMKYDEDNELVILSHSHGCNLVNALTHLIKPERPIELLIHFACPRRKKEDHYQPINYKKLVYFFSDGDVITVLGRVPEAEIGETLKNVTKAVVLPFGWNLDKEQASISDIHSYFKEMTNEFKPSLKANDASEIRNLNALGLHTRINGTDPGHSPIVDAVKYLTTIMETLSKKYPNHVNTIFDLTIDETQNSPLMINVKKEYVDTHKSLLEQEFNDENSAKAPSELSTIIRLLRSARQGAAIGGYFAGSTGGYFGMAAGGPPVAASVGGAAALMGMLSGSAVFTAQELYYIKCEHDAKIKGEKDPLWKMEMDQLNADLEETMKKWLIATKEEDKETTEKLKILMQRYEAKQKEIENSCIIQ